MKKDNLTISYAGATDFDGVPGQEYPLAYNGSGSLVNQGDGDFDSFS